MQTATASVPRDGATAPLRHPELLLSSKVNEVRILEAFAVMLFNSLKSQKSSMKFRLM